MKRFQFIYGTKIFSMAIGHIFFSLLLTAAAAQVTLSWDINYPEPDGYRLYQRPTGEENFTEIWSGTENVHTIHGLIEGTTYYFVVRAFKGSIESDNSNEVEFTPSSSASSDNDDNSPPDKPELDHPMDGSARVGLTPTLITGSFSDRDTDSHAKTCYQISTSSDFSDLVFEKNSSVHLTQFKVPDLILEPDTTYYWRAKFYDNREGASGWSATFEFTTIDYETAGDVNGNGILDEQEIAVETDLDANGEVDSQQAGLQVIKTADGNNALIAVKRMQPNIHIGSMLSMDSEQLPRTSNDTVELTNVISFKLYLQDDTVKTTVIVYFSKPAPADALWYKYDLDEGWQIYNHAVFSNDRKSVTLLLEDGGNGDLDGVKNGIIVDPAGLGYISWSSSNGIGDIGCFITGTSMEGTCRPHLKIIFLMLAVMGFIIISKTHRTKA